MDENYKTLFFESIIDSDHSNAMKVVKNALDNGNTPEDIIFKVLIPTMESFAEVIRVGQDATLAQLYLAAQISSELTDWLIPLFSEAVGVKGTIVLGSAFEDFHGLGKKIVGGCLKARMVEVIDLGLSVTAERFVEVAIENNADVIGVSSMMLHTARGEMGPIRIRELIEQKQLSDRVSLIVGGAPYRFHPELYREVGADAWAGDGLSAAEVVLDLISGKRAK